MVLPKQFVSCDWGTSNFRLRLVNTETLEVVKEHSTEKGVKKLYQEYNNQNEYEQSRFFTDYLMKQLQYLPLGKDNTLVVASGMASSSIGIQELKYSKVPFGTSGQNLLSHPITVNKDISLLLVSGVRTDENVMRGEEIQALGLAEYLSIQEKGILLLPGTHSKHIYFEKNEYKDFTTYLTGELFETLSSQTILKDSIKKTSWDDKYNKAFLDGVNKGTMQSIIGTLFTIRARDLLQSASKEENYYFMSGLLIGNELAYLKYATEPISLAASGMLYHLYKLALETISPNSGVSYFEGEVLEKALLLGQKKILEAYV